MVTVDEVEKRARRDARQRGIFLTSDEEQLSWLIEGLKSNEEKYGYPSCPCRLATGNFKLDRDIICPCDYRDPDIREHGACYCNFYVDKEIHEGKKKAQSIPERRPLEKQLASMDIHENSTIETSISVNVIPVKTAFYCKQCGYMVFREEPPYICPICQAKREMFEPVAITLKNS